MIVIMTIWIPNIHAKNGPRYLVIADCLSEDIKNGRLRKNDKLPPQRNLAYDLGVSLNTISRAYAEAERRGLVYAEVGRGTFIRDPGPVRLTKFIDTPRPTEEDEVIDLTMNLPVVGPAVTELERQLPDIGRHASLSELLDYRTEKSTDRHKKAGADWISRIGLSVLPEDITITVGGQQALLVSLMATTRPGDILLVEELTYPAILQIAKQLGLKVTPVPMDEFGLCPEALTQICTNMAAKVLYTMPTLQSPTTRTMPEERRREIAKIARDHDLMIIEDDVFGYLPLSRPLPLAAFAPERTLFITSLSKSVAPWLRVGYLVAPKSRQNAARTAVHMACWVPPPLMTEIATNWILNGSAEHLTRWQQQEAQTRQKIAAKCLEGIPYHADPHGLHLWLPLAENLNPERFVVDLEKRSVKTLPASAFSCEGAEVKPALRLCLGAETSRARIEVGLSEIANLLTSTAQPRLIV